MGLPITIRLTGDLDFVTVQGHLAIPLGFQGAAEYITVQGNLSIPLGVHGESSYTENMSAGLGIPLGMRGTMDYSEFGDLHITLPVVQINFEGLVENFGALTLQLPMLTVNLSVYTSVEGDLNISIPLQRFAATGLQEEEGSLNITLPMTRFKASGYPSMDGDLHVTLPMLIFEGSTLFGQVGNLAINLPMQRIEFNAIGSVEGDLSVTIPMLFVTFEEEAATYFSMAMNLKNKAPTIFTNYKFNSMCAFGGKHFGATKTGIFDLDTGKTDNGTLFDWNLKIGYLDLEQKKKKKLIQSWLSYKTDGDVKVTVIQPDGESYEYILLGIEETETGLRLKFGKGIRTKYVALNMESINGSTLELDEWKLHFAESTFPKVR